MHKLNLDLDALVVESFAAEGAVPGRGTVRGAERWEEPVDHIQTMQASCVSCQATCVNCGTGVTCFNTCAATCGDQATCNAASCRLSYCGDSCEGNVCGSWISAYPQICP